MQEEFKTKDYVLRAQKNYRVKHDNVNVSLPKGMAEQIRTKSGLSVNAYINKLVREDMSTKYGVDI